MAIELNTSSIKTSLSTDATINAGQGASQSKKLAPILGGDSLTVTSGVMTDLEELVAKLKSESADTRQSVSQRRISVLSSVLDTMSDRISASDRDALVKIEELNGDKTSAQESIATLQGEKLTTQNTITELDLQIEALERQIEQAVEDGAEHREQVAKLKEQRAEEQEKLDSIESSIKSLTNKISDIDVQISVYTASISKSTLSKKSFIGLAARVTSKRCSRKSGAQTSASVNGVLIMNHFCLNQSGCGKSGSNPAGTRLSIHS